MLKEMINEDMKIAMREKDNIKLNAIRMIKADIKNQEINSMKELDEEGVLKIISSAIKKRKDSIEQFRNANRLDLVEKEEAELKAIEKYLPKQLTTDEIKAIIKECIDATDEASRKNFGMIMKQVTQKTSGKADGKLVSELVKEVVNVID